MPKLDHYKRTIFFRFTTWTHFSRLYFLKDSLSKFRNMKNTAERGDHSFPWGTRNSLPETFALLNNGRIVLQVDAHHPHYTGRTPGACLLPPAPPRDSALGLPFQKRAQEIGLHGTVSSGILAGWRAARDWGEDGGRVATSGPTTQTRHEVCSHGGDLGWCGVWWDQGGALDNTQ